MSKDTTQKEQTIEEMIAEMHALEAEALALHTRAAEVRERIRERLASLDVSLGGAVKRTRRAASTGRASGTTASVLAFAAGQDEFTVDDVAKAASVAAPPVRNALTGLCKRGLVERFDRGRYRITDAGKKAAAEK